MKKQNILQVSAALQEGGVERGTVDMAHYIKNQGAGSFVASAGGRMVADLSREAISHFQIPLNLRNPFSVVYCGFKLASYIRENNITLVHARSRAPAWAALLACKLTNTTFITTFHGTHKIQNAAKRLYNSSMVRGKRVIAISRFIEDHIISNYGVHEDNISIAHRGTDLEHFDADKFSAAELLEKKQELGVDGKFVITLPGRLTRWKGQVEFLKALAQIKDDTSWHALIVGGCGKKVAYKDELDALVFALGLKDRVTFAGSQKNIPIFYAISDVIVSASNEPEAFGRVAIEAGAMKKCIVATAHGGSLETVKHEETGFLVPPFDIDTMAKILRRVIKENALLDEMGLKGYARVQKKFTVKVMCESEWKAYKRVIF